jgi:hypothetical protein
MAFSLNIAFANTKLSLVMIILESVVRMCENSQMKKVVKSAWTDLLKLEDEHPFSAGNLGHLNASLPLKSGKKRFPSKKASPRQQRKMSTR